MKSARICVIGLGYIGLPTASLFATHGFQVLGVDIDEQSVRLVNQGKVPIQEPGLNTLVRAAVNSGNLVAKTAPEPSDVFVIAVPTPIRPDKTADLSCVVKAAHSLVSLLKPGNLVILESTSPPRTSEDLLVSILSESGLTPGKDLFIAHCPERVLPGNILHELVYNSRIIGGIDPLSAEKAKELYSQVVQGEIVLTDATSAEMAKLMENTFRDVNIALVNELAKVCRALGMNAYEVIRLANMHPRVNLLQPGPGVGGHCLAVDPWFIVEKSPDARLIRLSREINDAMPNYVAGQALEILAGLNDPKVTVLGVAYKGNVDDTRESPATEVIEHLLAAGITVGIYDPQVKNYDFPLQGLEMALQDSDMVLVLSDHNEFKYLSPEELGNLMRTRNAFDAKKCLNRMKWEQAGFRFSQLGSN